MLFIMLCIITDWHACKKIPLNLTALAVFELSVNLLFSNLLVGELVMIPKW